MHIEHMLYSRAMMTVKKKVLRPEVLFSLTLIWKTAGAMPGRVTGASAAILPEYRGRHTGRISWL